ncbi:hypothetical protein PR048_016952 [Dryococelus australis]|uniref:Endonuclease/exonuclease/phosphatase domain-containing protein n=1 Tax=Dryococelus australis TaxID=614101 RepID=A0ABQ9H881_9NEOP|nr:hypothetical protein PR048_016952 [Dryococelus australis]
MQPTNWTWYPQRGPPTPVTMTNEPHSVPEQQTPTQYDDGKLKALVDTIAKRIEVAKKDVTYVFDSDSLNYTWRGPSNTRPSAIDLTMVSAELLGIMDWRVHEDNWGSDHFPVITSSRLGQAIHRPLYNEYLKLYTKSAGWWIFVSSVNEHIDELPKVTENSVLIAHEAFCTFLLLVAWAASWWTSECEEASRHRLTALCSYKAQSTLGNFLKLKRKQMYTCRVWSASKKSAWANFCQSLSLTTPSWHRIKRRTPNLPDDLVTKWIAYIAPDFAPSTSSFVLPSFRP